VFATGEKFKTITSQTINDMRFIYEVDIVPVKEGDKVARAITVLRDITAEKEAEEKIKAALREKEVLLREIHHRVKNNLQVMSSLLSLQADYIHDPHTLALFRETQSRLRSMALIHEELYQSQNLSEIDYDEYIQKLTTNLFHAFSSNAHVQLEMQLDPLRFGIDMAIPCGLIINELVTNALKYAFPDQRKGIIRVDLESIYTDDRVVYVLKIQDDGIGLPESIDIENTDTLGLQLVNILVKQIKGSLTLKRDGGTRFTIRFSERQGTKA
jgi:two-component sensor histidine kinase